MRVRQVALATLLLSSACAPAAPPAAAPRPAEVTDELIVGAPADEFKSEYEPLKSRLGNYPFAVNMCETLVRLGEDFSLQPLLATSWELSGPNTWRFKLRDGITFWDGSKMSAEDVKWSLDRTALGKQGYSFIGEASTRVVDPMTVEVTPTQPNLRLVEQILHPTYAVMKKDTDLATQPMCTGPFKFVEYVKDQRIVVERYPSYWGDKARVQKVTFRFFPDANTRRLALESGEIDFLMDLPREQVTSTKGRPGLKVTNAPVGRTMLMYLNIHGQEPYVVLQDSAVRHAIGYAIDHPTMVDKVWEGNAAVVLTMGPPEVLGAYAKEVQGYTYDSSRANQLLDAAGWVKGADGVRAKSGKRLSITLIGWAEWDRQTLEYLQSQLGAVGIEMKIVKSPDQASYSKLLDAGEFDIDLEGPNQNDGNPIFLPALRFYSKASSKNMPFFAPRGRFDELVEAGSAATDRATTQQRAAEAMHLLIDEEAIVIPVAGLFRIYAMKDSVQGFLPHPSQTNQWWNSVSKTR
ncbi:MAG TPA: ABC transporter substrate-binding protein [Chloroflexota bacterium]|nr:ABC transporter substrate-binding protein [Chloroflexota bacterium]